MFCSILHSRLRGGQASHMAPRVSVCPCVRRQLRDPRAGLRLQVLTAFLHIPRGPCCRMGDTSLLLWVTVRCLCRGGPGSQRRLWASPIPSPPQRRAEQASITHVTHSPDLVLSPTPPGGLQRHRYIHTGQQACSLCPKNVQNRIGRDWGAPASGFTPVSCVCAAPRRHEPASREPRHLPLLSACRG